MDTALRVVTPPASDGTELTAGERLLVSATRRVACGGGDPRLVEREFLAVCGADGPTAWIAFRSLLVLLAIYGRRPLVVGPPSWSGLTADELGLLQIFAAAQIGDPDRLAAHLAWRMRPAPGADPALLAGVVARALAAAGHDLRLRGR